LEHKTIDAFINGVREFNLKEYYNSHEYFEDIWLNHNIDDRLFIQALIQLAVAYFHITNDNKNGAISLFRKATKKLDNYYNHNKLILNINDVIKSAYESYDYLQGIDSMNEFKWELAPQLELNDLVNKKF